MFSHWEFGIGEFRSEKFGSGEDFVPKWTIVPEWRCSEVGPPVSRRPGCRSRTGLALWRASYDRPFMPAREAAQADVTLDHRRPRLADVHSRRHISAWLAHHSSGGVVVMGISRASGWSPMPGARISASSVSGLGI